MKENPGLVKIPREDWLVCHDCERFVLKLWERALREMMGRGVIERESLCAGSESDELKERNVSKL